MFTTLASTLRVIDSSSFFVIASEARQSLICGEIASAGFANLAMTERKRHSSTERGRPFDACEQSW
jgi:hypothetical protein